MPDAMKTFPMQFAWRFALILLPVLGAVALVTAGAEMLGFVARGAWLGEAGDGERWAAIVVGILLLPFGLSALAHARLTIDTDEIRYLGFGVLCKTRQLPLADVRRWGHAVGRNQGRREPMLVFERQDGNQTVIKVAMYAHQTQIRALLTERLGPAVSATATMTGVRFDDAV